MSSSAAAIASTSSAAIDAKDGASQQPTSSSYGPREMAPSAGGRVSGKAWKTEKTATKRTYMQPGVKTASWSARESLRLKAAQTKSLERSLKAEKEAEELATRQRIKERRERRSERARMEEMEARLGRKKALRKKKREGRNAKVNQ